MIVNLHFNWLPENALNRHIKSGCQIRKYILCYSSDREVERRSTVYKKILDDHGKTQEGSGQYISHTIYTRNTLSRFSTTFCIGECSNSSVESIILILVRKLVVDRLYFCIRYGRRIVC